MNLLTIHLDFAVPSRPVVRLLIDGQDILACGDDLAHDVEDILLNDALVPQDPPRRIAFYGCGCGAFGCGNVAGLVRRTGDVVVWSDFRSVTGAYDGALSIEGVADPVTQADVSSRRLRLPTLTFDAGFYLTSVRAATASARNLRR